MPLAQVWVGRECFSQACLNYMSLIYSQLQLYSTIYTSIWLFNCSLYMYSQDITMDFPCSTTCIKQLVHNYKWKLSSVYVWVKNTASIWTPHAWTQSVSDIQISEFSLVKLEILPPLSLLNVFCSKWVLWLYGYLCVKLSVLPSWPGEEIVISQWDLPA